ncbi:MAG: hypothetical protein NPIRA05_02920 [Nitrospirales bacterium]|nr:MAG: hypothetical protein NPIRA05_02920 [Nitrospirales bacterium]
MRSGKQAGVGVSTSQNEQDKTWKLHLERFFFDRAVAVDGKPTLLDHVLVSAKDPRLAGREDFHADLIESLLAQLQLDGQSTVLEVGCASGYITCGLAPKVRSYNGVDLAASPLEVARRMELPNAEFQQADAGKLPFAADQFDAAFAYDVLSNFPSFEQAIPLLEELLRVVRPGGRIMAGSITDADQADTFQQHVYDVSAQLEEKYGPQPISPELTSNSWLAGLVRRVVRRLRRLPAPPAVEVGSITNFTFLKSDFEKFAQSHECHIAINDVHALNPYMGYRYNVVMTKSDR